MLGLSSRNRFLDEWPRRKGKSETSPKVVTLSENVRKHFGRWGGYSLRFVRWYATVSGSEPGVEP